MITKKKMTIFIPYFFIAIFYAIFHMKYMPEYLDDAWSLSWAYRLLNFNDVTDHVFGYVNTRGSILFGRGYSYFYGTILQVVGWSRSNAVIISTLLLWTTAFIWFKSIIKLGYKKSIAHTVTILFLIMEIYFAIGNKLRSDSLALCLISFAFYLFISKKYFVAGFLAIVAFEVHAISLTYFFYILAYLISILDEMKRNPKFYIKGALVFISGIILGLIYYYWLQHDYLQYFFEKTTNEMVGHTFFSYFWKMKFAWRHLPELGIVVIAVVVFFKNQYYKKDKFILPFFISCILSSFVLRRGNYHYVAFVYPSVLLLIAFVSIEIDKIKYFWMLLLFYLIPQYGFLYYNNHSFNQKEYEANLIKVMPIDDLFILGNSGAWFALKERNFHENGFFSRGASGLKEAPKSLYLISNKRYKDNVTGYKEFNDNFFKGYEYTKINSFKSFDNSSVDIYFLKKEGLDE